MSDTKKYTVGDCDAQSRQSTKLSLQSSEVGLPHTAGESVPPPPPPFGSGEKLPGEGVGGPFSN